MGVGDELGHPKGGAEIDVDGSFRDVAVDHLIRKAHSASVSHSPIIKQYRSSSALHRLDNQMALF